MNIDFFFVLSTKCMSLSLLNAEKVKGMYLKENIRSRIN